ncbi:MAG: hypothetical protein GWN00_25020, partial [Aliifodinibius sp.]|nr:hypothetical protein [Fodinibius sp.]NIV14126.1 hypothetical protein [Fodinibius sp.]NIY27947.1 hypothetical protein [Fodinibius sp.]
MKKIYKYILILIFGLFSFQLSAQVRSYGWQSGPPLNTPRVGASAVVLDGYIYVMGGKTTNNQILNTVERFDPATNTWDDTTVAPFMDTRYNAAAAVFNSEIYLIGGRGYYNDILDEVEVYNPQTNRWREIEKLDREREGHVAVLLRNHICVMGGIRDNGQFVAEIEWYNGSDWIEAPNDLGSPRAVPFAASVADSFYMFGGERISGLTNTGYRAEVTPGWFFNWTSLPDLQIARGYGASAILDNKMYMIAGMTFNSTSDHVEIFDLNTYQIENGPTFPEPRMGMTAATLNGDIYVIGGSNHIDPLTDVE